MRMNRTVKLNPQPSTILKVSSNLNQKFKIKNKNEFNFLTPVDEDLSDLFDKSTENTLQNDINVNKQNANLQLDNSKAKQTEDLDDIFNAINEVDLAALEEVENHENDWNLQVDLPKNNPQKNIKSIPQNTNKEKQTDEDFSDLLAIQDQVQDIKNNVKVEMI